jgi:RecB family endonuclease NucS
MATFTKDQLKELIGSLGTGRHASLAFCQASYDGRKNAEALEAFLATAKTFKEVEHITDSEALTGLPLLLHGEAGKWW